MRKNILNYTSTMPVDRILAGIQEELRHARATSILFEYTDSGEIKAIFFKIRSESGEELPFRIPTKVEEAYKKLFANAREPRFYNRSRVEEALERRKDQAKRTAWKIVYDWLKAQLTIIELQQAKAEEVFLPYLMVEKNMTLFESMQSRHFQLPSGK